MFYGCSSFWKRGAKVCSNNLVARLDVLEAEVLATFQDDVFRPAVISEAVRVALDELSPRRQDERRSTLENDRDLAKTECQRFAAGIAQGGALPTLLECLRDAELRVQRADADLRALATEAGPFVNLATLERRIMAKLTDWRRMSRHNITDGRSVLRALLMEPLRFTPVVDGRRRGYTFEGRIALNRLLAGVIDLPTKLASPAGLPTSVFVRGPKLGALLIAV